MKCKEKSCKEIIVSFMVKAGTYAFKYHCTRCSTIREVLIDSSECDTINEMIETMI